MSELGAVRCPGLAEKRGIVIGGSRNPGTIRIMLDGNVSPTMLHRDYVELIAGEAEAAEHYGRQALEN